jgi:galactokinase
MADEHLSLSRLRDRFCQLYGAGDVYILRAPARLNILGEHVDYVSYLPTTSITFGSHQHSMLMLYRPTSDGTVRGASTNQAFAPFCFSLAEEAVTLAQATDWESYVFSRPAPVPDWSNYVCGAVRWAQWRYGAQIKSGFDFLIDSTIPACGGASSSSALTCLAGAALRGSNGIYTPPAVLARESAQAEWFVGTRGGAMDHLTICAARRGCALLISHQTQQVEYVGLPSEPFYWVTFFSHAADKGREVMLEYNERAAVSRLFIPGIIDDWACQRVELFNEWQRALRATDFSGLEKLLRELPETIRLIDLASFYPETYRKCEAAFPALIGLGEGHSFKVRARALHHLGEIKRVNNVVALLKAAYDGAEPSIEKMHSIALALGEQINATHASLHDLYEVSTPEVEALRACLLAEAQVYGARLIGGGFGGNVLALVNAEQIKPLIERVQHDYYALRNRNYVSEGAVMLSLPGDGLSPIRL